VIEKDPVYVGGISRTVEYNGFMFDIGGTASSPSRRKWSTSGRRSCRTISSSGRACRASTTAASITRIR
jgi:protoporphyrinogen oxidase